MGRLVSAVVLCLLCACMRTADLIPQNEIAATTGTIQAKFGARGIGTGEVNMATPQGVTFAGRYLLYRRETAWEYDAALLAMVFGKPAIKAIAAQSIDGMPLWSPGIADATGSNGVSVHCELVNNNHTFHGEGVCRFSDGAIYSLQF